MEIDEIYEKVRGGNYRCTIENSNGDIERLVDIGELMNNEDLIVLCFEGHRFTFIEVNYITYEEDGENIQYHLYTERDEPAQATIKCKKIRG